MLHSNRVSYGNSCVFPKPPLLGNRLIGRPSPQRQMLLVCAFVLPYRVQLTLALIDGLCVLEMNVFAVSVDKRRGVVFCIL